MLKTTGKTRFWRAAAAALLTFAAPLPLAAAGAAEPAQEAAAENRDAPRPAIWLLEDEDTKIYLFGTVHLLPPGLEWRSAALDRIVSEADELVLEAVDLDDFTPEEAAEIMMLGKQVPLVERVSRERRTALREMIDTSGVPAEVYDGMHTWAAVFVLEIARLIQAYTGEEPLEAENLTGVEDALTADFRKLERPISGVETAAQQLGFFGKMPMSEQRAMLEQMIDAYTSGETILDPQERSWLSGDTEAIAEEMKVLPPGLFDILLTQRNTTWTGWLIERLKQPGKILFAVGAGHLAGEVSVQEMLARRGYTVTRID